MYQPDRNIIGHLYIPAGSPLRPVFWTTDWGKRWPCQYRSLLRIQEQLGLHKVLTPRESLGPVDRDDWAQYAAGPRRSPQTFFDWAKVPIVNEWGDKCQGPNGRTGASFVIPRTWARTSRKRAACPTCRGARVQRKRGRRSSSRRGTRRRPRSTGTDQLKCFCDSPDDRSCCYAPGRAAASVIDTLAQRQLLASANTAIRVRFAPPITGGA